MEKIKKLVVFDLDGTLNQTRLFGVPAYQQALCEAGISNISEETIMGLFGADVDEFLDGLLSDRSHEEGMKVIRRAQELEKVYIQKKCAPFPGVPETLRELRAGGYCTAVCSNSYLPYITLVLDALHLREDIDFIRPLVEGMTKVDTLRLLLEETQPEKAVMVGDRHYDRTAAKENGIAFIGCLYGYNPEEMEGSDACASHAGELADCVKRLIG